MCARVRSCASVGTSRYPNASRHLVCMRNGGGLITSQRAEIFPAFCLFFQSAIFGRHYAAKRAAAGRPDGVRRIPDKVAQFPTNACEDLADVGFDPRA